MEEVAAGQLLGYQHAVHADGACVVGSAGCGVRERVPQRVRHVAVVEVAAEPLGHRHGDRADIKEEDRVDELERQPVQEPDVQVVRERHRLDQHVGHQLGVVQDRALALPRLPSHARWHCRGGRGGGGCVGSGCAVGVGVGKLTRRHMVVHSVHHVVEQDLRGGKGSGWRTKMWAGADYGRAEMWAGADCGRAGMWAGADYGPAGMWVRCRRWARRNVGGCGRWASKEGVTKVPLCQRFRV
eukprot:360269-Chlamydomonas_euryale.AAC.1